VRVQVSEEVNLSIQSIHQTLKGNPKRDGQKGEKNETTLLWYCDYNYVCIGIGSGDTSGRFEQIPDPTRYPMADPCGCRYVQ
jgi:hypothetical protein